MNAKPVIAWGVGVAVVGFVVAVAIAPIVSAHQLIKAAKAGDVAGIEKRVDFPAFRESLKTELEQELARRIRTDARVRERGLEGVAAMLAPMVAAGAVDAVVTPQTVAAMASSGEAPDPTDPNAPPKPPKDDEGVHQAWGYRGLNHFAVTLTRFDDPTHSLAFVLERRGLFDWKLAAVDLQTVD